jgi:protein-disulfide isomerase
MFPETMPMRRFFPLMILLAAPLAMAATPRAAPKAAPRAAAKAPPRPVAAKPADWTTRVSLSPIGGYVMGNPTAPTKLIEYVSYTCPHCARLINGTGDSLEIGWVRGGKVSVEVRNRLFNGFDLTAAVLARCGGPTKFYGNHKALFANFEGWMARFRDFDAIAPTLEGKPQAEVMTAIADKTGLFILMEKRGFKRPQLVACMKDKNALTKVLAMSADADKKDIRNTPSVFINGKLADVGEEWERLKAALPPGAS